MNIALVSLIALLLAVVISGFSRLNVGILAIVLAWIVGHYLAGQPLADIVGLFPLNLATMLFGITYLFAIAQINGTLERASNYAICLTRGHRALIPLVFFALSATTAAIGPGNISAVALLAPVGMTIAGRAGIGAFLMTVMIANGANAGAFSPFAPTGIIANGLIGRLGIQMDPWTQVFLPSALAQTFVALVSYLLLGGLKLWRQDSDKNGAHHVAEVLGDLQPLNRHQILTVVAIVAFILGVILFKIDPAFWAITLALILNVVGAGDQEAAIKAIPWSTIMMVCGFSVLIGILQRTGGIDLFTSLLASISTISNVTLMLGFLTGVISAYSSSSGVVMPTFIPLIPDLISKLGGGNPVALASAINVGSHLVDVSPLSTLGALCIANADPNEDKQVLFRSLLYYGLSMAVIGALVCWVFFGLLLPAP